MRDGSVTFLSESIDLVAYQARSTIAAEDIFSESTRKFVCALNGEPAHKPPAFPGVFYELGVVTN